MGYALCRRPPIIAHCCRIADSWHCCKRILSCWYTSLSFGMIGGFIVVSWGTLGWGSITKGNFEIQAWIFTDF